MDQTQQVIQNLGVEIANKSIEVASLKAQVSALQVELQSIKTIQPAQNEQTGA